MDIPWTQQVPITKEQVTDAYNLYVALSPNAVSDTHLRRDIFSLREAGNSEETILRMIVECLNNGLQHGNWVGRE